MGVDAGGAVFPGLPGAPPVAGEVEVVVDLPGQLVHRDAEGVGEGDGGGEDGLLVASLVASELSKADAGALASSACERPRAARRDLRTSEMSM